mmetsp:Transcript_73389/g.189327  ORF Transcript_73389/g.189327 Transcript_73389/m.189327 type:complete len:92 (-) Transcript_73389:221-496(-)
METPDDDKPHSARLPQKPDWAAVELPAEDMSKTARSLQPRKQEPEAEPAPPLAALGAALAKSERSPATAKPPLSEVDEELRDLANRDCVIA